MVDNEYATASVREPKILLTTSRNPSAALTQFVKLKVVFPMSQRMNRGGQVISEIVESCWSHDITDLILVHEHRGQPDGLIVSHLPNGPTAYFGLLNVVTQHDIKGRNAMEKMSEAYPHLVLDNFSTQVNHTHIVSWKQLTALPSYLIFVVMVSCSLCVLEKLHAFIAR
ncbi:uncharacterized protein [Miscanthus floridulus]|uniref:uncharacterized protein isoform X2 n=1 Tax=Miscanthus floridulus TaxID=154761 RepID=UPI0034580E48